MSVDFSEVLVYVHFVDQSGLCVSGGSIRVTCFPRPNQKGYES